MQSIKIKGNNPTSQLEILSRGFDIARLTALDYFGISLIRRWPTSKVFRWLHLSIHWSLYRLTGKLKIDCLRFLLFLYHSLKIRLTRQSKTRLIKKVLPLSWFDAKSSVVYKMVHIAQLNVDRLTFGLVLFKFTLGQRR